jgi:CheY-like chemotaxis protein
MPVVWVIEDHADLRCWAEGILREGGYDVVAFPRAPDVATRRKAPAPDVVLTDFLMEVRDGFDVIRELSASKPRPRIIAMSGGGAYLRAGDLLPTARRLGADAALEKPFTSAQLLDAVARVLKP